MHTHKYLGLRKDVQILIIYIDLYFHKDLQYFTT